MEVPLIRADVDKDNLIHLFDRIGHGGTPLRDEERRYSIYKHHWPHVHDAVSEIALDPKLGRVLPPVKIADSAILIGNAKSHEKPDQGNYPLDVETFMKEMASDDVPQRRRQTIADELGQLLPAPAEDGSQPNPRKLAKAFKDVFYAMKYCKLHNSIGIPKIMLTTLSPNLVQVLVLWAIHAREREKAALDLFQDIKHDLIRFILFWCLGVTNQDKSRSFCFEQIRSSHENVSFEILYQGLVNNAQNIAIPMISPDMMKNIVCSNRELFWQRNEDRFKLREGIDEPSRELARRWWQERGDALLLWLQRAYLETVFSSFDPASGTDEDTPYDVDHMVPQSAWGGNRSWSDRLLGQLNHDKVFNTAADQNGTRYARHELGNSIGNKWLIDFSINRSWGKKPFPEKLLDIQTGEFMNHRGGVELLEGALSGSATSEWHLANVGGDENWTKEQLAAFQTAIENRSAWLYERFYKDLGFSKWLQNAEDDNETTQK